MNKSLLIAGIVALSLFLARKASAYEPSEDEIRKEIESASWRDENILTMLGLGSGPVWELGQEIVKLERQIAQVDASGRDSSELRKKHAKMTREYAIAALKLVHGDSKK